MAANTGELISNTYLIPQYSNQNQGGIGGQMGGQQGAPYNDNIDALQGLQHVQNQTSDYYRKVAALKSFMQDVHNNLGIDVRVPDYSKGEAGIKLNELYNYALADIMAQGNLLKNSHGTMSNLVNQHARFTTDPTSKPADQMIYGQDYNFQQPSGLVKERNDQIKALYDAGDYRGAQEQYEATRQYLEEQGKQNPHLAKLFQTDLMALEPPRKGVFRPTSARESYQERNYGRKVNTAGNFVDDLVFLSNGARNSYAPDTSQLNDEGNPYLISKEFAGMKMGPNKEDVIKQWRMNPDTKQIELVLANGNKINASEDTGSIIRTLMAYNGAGKGIGNEHLEEYLDKHGLQDENSQIDQPLVMGRRNKEWMKLQEANVNKGLKEGETTTKKAVELLEDKLQQLRKPGSWYNPTTYGAGYFGDEVQVGPYIVHRTDEGYEINNIKEVHPPVNFKDEKEAKRFYGSFHKFTTMDQILNFLKKQNAHVKFLKANNISEPVQSTQTQQPSQPQGLAPGSLD